MLELIKEVHDPIDFGDKVYFRCQEGRKFEADIFKANQSAICRQGNLWDPPAEGWMKCVDSELERVPSAKSHK